MQSFPSALGAVTICLWPLAASADQISLTYRDGGEVLSGELLDHDADSYRIDTIFGVLTVNARAVTCQGEACPDLSAFLPDITIAGAEAGRRLFAPLWRAFAEAQGLTLEQDYVTGSETALTLSDPKGNPAARLTLRFLGADEGFADLLTGEADLVLSARRVRDDEAARLQEAGLGRLDDPGSRSVVALDALVPFGVGRSGPVAYDQLVAMLGGTQDLWTSDQGDEVPVVVDPGLDVSGLDAVDQVQSQGGQIDGPHLRVGLFSTRRGNPVLGLSGQCGAVMRADHWTLGSEDYPLTLPLYLFRPARRLPDIARDFLRFVASEEGAIAVDATGFASPYPQNLTLDEQGGRLARALTLIEEDDAFADLRALARDFVGAERLSVGFRFQEGSAELDAPSMANVGILAQYLRDGAARGRAVVFAGFGDGIGSASANRSLSADRAETVRQAVTAALGAAASKFAFESKGFGEGLPLACDADAWGRHANRRVEVWLR